MTPASSDDHPENPSLVTETDVADCIAAATASNNGRISTLAMSGRMKRAAERAVAIGAMRRYFASHPGYGMVAFYELQRQVGR